MNNPDRTFHDLKTEKYDALVQDYLEVIENGLPKSAGTRDIVIIGAGVSGLVAGTLLREAGHNVKIIEASQRVGGRVKTFREEFSGDLYAEAGAMRLPSHHALLMRYLEKQKIETRPFFIADIDPATEKNEVATPRNNSFMHLNGVQIRKKDYSGGEFGYPLPKAEEGQTSSSLLHEAVRPLMELLEADPENGWDIIRNKFDEYSVRRFLKEQTLYSEAAIEMIGVIENLESRMMTSFIQSFIEMFNINPSVKYSEVVGGTDLFTESFRPNLEDCITFGAWVKGIEWSPTGSGVKVHIRDMPTVTGDVLLVTIPFTSLRFVDINPLLSHEKRKAIRQLHYDASSKVLLEFDYRFWEHDDGIYGGGSVTDLPNRFMYYPHDGMGGDGGGVVLASYTWAEDALRWDSLAPELRYEFALDGMAKIHGEGIRKSYVGGAYQSWMDDPFALGEAAIFAPGQMNQLQSAIEKQEGNIHFAGEHCSLRHAWIEGAIDSAIRSALKINNEM
jgi:monoamine oxidase